MYKRIRDLREDRDLSQIEVAKFLNMSQTGYSKYEVGTNDIPTKILIQLAKFYNTSIDYLLGITDEIKPYKRWFCFIHKNKMWNFCTIFHCILFHIFILLILKL